MNLRHTSKNNYVTILFVGCFILTSTLNAFTTAYYEGEDFARQSGGNVISNKHFPYIGTGYLDMGGRGETATWKIPVAESGKYTLIFKYANHTEGDLPCDVSVNGVYIRNIPFSPFDKDWKVYWELVQCPSKCA